MKVQVTDVVIVDGDKLLLVQQRKKSAYGLWGFPGGHVEPGETPEMALHREVNEEIGVKLIHAKPFKVYSFKTATEELELHTFRGEIKGTIRLNNDELMAYEWFNLDSLKMMHDQLRSPIVLEQARDALIGF